MLALRYVIYKQKYFIGILALKWFIQYSSIDEMYGYSNNPGRDIIDTYNSINMCYNIILSILKYTQQK